MRPPARPSPSLALLPLLFLASPGLAIPSPSSALTTAQAQVQAQLSLPATRGDSLFPELGQRGLDVEHYDLSLNFPAAGGGGSLIGEATLSLRAAEALSVLALDFSGLSVSEVRWEGRPVAATRRAEKLLVPLPRPLRPGEGGQLQVRYGGTPQPVADSGVGLPFGLGWQSWTRGALGGHFLFSEPDGSRSLFPANDHPSDPATFTLRVTLPAELSVGASGRLTQETRQGSGSGAVKTLTFVQAQPIPTYALALQIGTLERVGAPQALSGGRVVERRDFFAPGLPTRVRRPYAQTGEMLRVLGEWFGPYPFEVYGSAVIPVDLPALETATLSVMPVGFSQERVIVHELAHQWFGNAVPLADWSQTWLNEGFATYAELLWAESRGLDPAPTVQSWERAIERVGPRPLVARTRDQLFDTPAYLQGALALHALRTAVGDATFRRLLQGQVRAFTGKPIDTAAWLAYLEREAGPDAVRAVRPWLEGTPAPRPWRTAGRAPPESSVKKR